jgi:hypothetical protein
MYRIGLRQAYVAETALIASSLFRHTNDLYFNVYKIITKLIVEFRTVRAH